MLGMPAQFEVEVDPQPGAPPDEVRLILEGGDDTLGIELLVVDGGTFAGGGLGTQIGVPDGSGFFIYFRTGGTGTVTRSAGGRGQILDGTMFGEISVGLEERDFGSQAHCIAVDHGWTLTPR